MEYGTAIGTKDELHGRKEGETMKHLRRYLLPGVTGALYVMCLFALLTGSLGYHRETPGHADGASVVQSVTAAWNGRQEEISLPHQFSELAARTPVTLTTEFEAESGDSLYVKSIYAPLKVYVNGVLSFTCGEEDSHPKFMIDPPTTVAVIPLGDAAGRVSLRMEYLSPSSRGTLAVQPLLFGAQADIMDYLMGQMGFSFLAALVLMGVGLVLIVVSLFIVAFEQKGIGFLYLGLFSLASGIWSFAECDVSGLFISNATLLYLLAFVGLLSLPIPLLMFGIFMIDFHNERPIRGLCLFDFMAATAAILLQLLGIVPFSRSMYLFHGLLPASLVIYAGAVLWEYVRYGSQTAKKFFAPMAVMALAAVLEAVNYQLRFTDVLSLFFESGVIVFVLMTGVIGGLYVREAAILRRQKQQLDFEVGLMELQIAGQKKHYEALLQNEELVRRQRHDLRHHLTVIRSYCADGETEKLSEYLDTLLADTRTGQGMYCENAAVNAVVAHYAELAQQNGIELSVSLTVPARLEEITDSSLCIIFGNLFENAIEACAQVGEGKRMIRLGSRVQYRTLTVVMDNSFDGTLVKRDGRLISRKRDDFGIGTGSVTAMAEKHGGVARFTADEGVFHASVYVRI